MNGCSIGPTPRASVSDKCRMRSPSRIKRPLSPTTLAAKSVALQGLPALEYLLYGDGAEALAKDDSVVAARLSPK